MTDHSPLRQPTQAQADQSVIAQTEILEAMARLHREGMDWRIVLTGAGCAIADTLNRNMGAAEIPKWFAQFSAMTMHLAKD